MNKYLIVLLILCCMAGLRCGQNALEQGGGGIETVALAGRAVYSGNTPAAAARVLLRTQNYLKDTAAATIDSIVTTKFDTKTDDSGYFVIDSVPAGLVYTLEINDGNSFASLSRGTIPADSSVHNLSTVTLRPTGSITGDIDSSASSGVEWYAQLYGLERAVRLDKTAGTFTLIDVPEGVYSIHIVSSSSLKPVITHDSVSVPSGDTVFLPYALWRYSQRLYLNTTASGADVPNMVTGFPVCIRLTGSNFNFGQAKNGGEDLRFTKSDNSPLPYEIEQWDSAQGQAEAWVTVDTVWGNNSTQYIMMYWGNSNAAGNSNSAAVFDTAMGFQGVWHLADSSASVASDATGNHFNGLKNGVSPASDVSGATGKAQGFNGSSSYISVPNTAAGMLDFPENGSYGFSAWVYADTLDGQYHMILSKGDNQYGMQIHNINEWEIFEFHGATGWQCIRTPAAARRWTYVVGIRAGSNEYLYVDGALADSTMITVSDTAGRNTSSNVYIGRRSDSPSDRYWGGTIDEVCIANVTRSADWIRLCYMNQKAVDALVNFR